MLLTRGTKHFNKEIREIAKEDPAYLRWMLEVFDWIDDRERDEIERALKGEPERDYDLEWDRVFTIRLNTWAKQKQSARGNSSSPN